MVTACIRTTLIGLLLMVSSHAQALLLVPGGEFTNESSYPAYSNPDAADISTILGVSVDLLYKDNHEGSEEGMANFMMSYETTYSNTMGDPSDALIEYISGDVITDANWLLVKDGDHDPIWYLFDISMWDGLEDIMMIGFWPDKGAISHVSIFDGDTTTRIPEPGSLWLFLLILFSFSVLRGQSFVNK
ncbi:MAG: PEP-CTERM sorting domain-containing protein [Ectothiorhodospiraceae bacterium]|nr:PEP-CTERM sorting domain-containing protein [Ectothiorhodospiraceae bacterium]